MHHGRRCHYCGTIAAAHMPRCRACGTSLGAPVYHAAGLSLGDLVPPGVSSAVEQAKQSVAQEVADVTSSVQDKYQQAKGGVSSAISSAQQRYEQAKSGLLGGLGGGAAETPAAPKPEPLGIGVYLAGAVVVGAVLIMGMTLMHKEPGA